jgi:hypothetical protein
MDEYSSTESMLSGSTERRRNGPLTRMACGVSDAGKRMVKRGFETFITAIDPDVARHLINANKEMMLAARSLVDYELRMADKALKKVDRHAAEKAASESGSDFIQPT